MDRLTQIFEMQKKIGETFLPIENAAGLGLNAIAGDGPHNIDDPKFQFVVKGYAWRVVEELAEAIDAYGTDSLHEELADMLHFFVELCLLLDMAPEHLVLVHPETVSKSTLDMLDVWWMKSLDASDLRIFSITFIQYFGMAMECLKNKPWKQTLVETNRNTLYTKMAEAGFAMVGIFTSCGMTTDDMMNGYFKKAQENVDRAERGR